jgi:hypothetical protein
MGPDEEDTYMLWSSNSLTAKTAGYVEATITNISLSVKDKVVFFNNNRSASYSLTQPIFIKDAEGTFGMKISYDICVGDTLIKILADGSITEELVIRIGYTELPEISTYAISVEPYDWFIAGGFLVHNK